MQANDDGEYVFKQNIDDTLLSIAFPTSNSKKQPIQDEEILDEYLDIYNEILLSTKMELLLQGMPVLKIPQSIAMRKNGDGTYEISIEQKDCPITLLIFKILEMEEKSSATPSESHERPKEFAEEKIKRYKKRFAISTMTQVTYHESDQKITDSTTWVGIQNKTDNSPCLIIEIPKYLVKE